MNRLELLNGVAARIDAIAEVTKGYRKPASEELKVAVANRLDDLLLFLKENFGGDDAMASEITEKSRRVSNLQYPKPSTKAFKAAKSAPTEAELEEIGRLDPEQQALCDDVRKVFTSPTINFDPAALVETRDGVIVALAARYTVSVIKPPLDTNLSKHFDDFANVHMGTITA